MVVSLDHHTGPRPRDFVVGFHIGPTGARRVVEVELSELTLTDVARNLPSQREGLSVDAFQMVVRDGMGEARPVSRIIDTEDPTYAEIFAMVAAGPRCDG